MALTTPRIIGRQVTIDCDGVKTIWDTLSVTLRDNTEGATASDSDDDEVVRTTQIMEFELSGFLGSVNNGGTLPAKGDAISDFDVSVGADTVLPTLAGFSNIKVLQTKYDFAAGPAKWSFSGRSGVLN